MKFEARLARKKVLFHQDNVPSHSRPLQWQNYELGYELIPHSSYSPDLAPCDFFLFPNLKTWLGRKKFSSNEEVIVAVNEYFADFETAYFKWLNVNYASFLAEIWPEGIRRVNLSRCRVIKWIVAPFHGNLPNLSNDPRIYISGTRTGSKPITLCRLMDRKCNRIENVFRLGFNPIFGSDFLTSVGTIVNYSLQPPNIYIPMM